MYCNLEKWLYSLKYFKRVAQNYKKYLPIFFIDLEPTAINNDIFHLNSLLNTKVKIEEPYKRRNIIYCINCQEYGHLKTYYAYSSS